MRVDDGRARVLPPSSYGVLLVWPEHRSAATWPSADRQGSRPASRVASEEVSDDTGSLQPVQPARTADASPWISRGPSGYDYEFDDAENAVISSAAYWAKLLGVFMIVTGAASLLSCNVVAFAIDLSVGITFRGAATSLSLVVNPQGNDIQHMMNALGKLRSAFKIRVIVVLVALVLVVVALALLTLFFVAFSPSR